MIAASYYADTFTTVLRDICLVVGAVCIVCTIAFVIIGFFGVYVQGRRVRKPCRSPYGRPPHSEPWTATRRSRAPWN